MAVGSNLLLLKTFTIFGCENCPAGSYSLDLGSAFTNFEKTIVHTAKCKDCPFGGICEKGNIKSRGRFWGYHSGTQVTFIPCPGGHCYDSLNLCHKIDTCAPNRQGYMCGNCRKNYYVDYFSNQCLHHSKCKHLKAFWSVFFIYALTYIVVFAYIDGVITKIKRLSISRNHQLNARRQSLTEICSKNPHLLRLRLP